MDFSIKTFDAKNTIGGAKTGCIAVGVFENRKLSQAASALDQNGAISAELKSGDLSGKAGSTLLLRRIDGVAAERVLLVGLGKEESIGDKDFSTAVQSIASVFAALGAPDAIVALPFENLKERDAAWAIRTSVLAARANLYRCDGMKSKKDPAAAGVKKVAFGVSAALAGMARTALAQAVAMADGVDLAKDLGNLPANICTPGYLASVAKKLAKDYHLGIEVLDRKQLQALKMDSFLSVTNGSVEAPKFIVLKHID